MSDALISDEPSDEPSDSGSLRPGTRLGRYELLLPIARGGMARVWAARQHGTRGFQKLVAIKTILPHLANEPEFERMFLDEARIASGVHHPNVCEIYDLGEERRTLYLAMEWVNGDSFSRLLRASGKTEACDYGVAGRVIADACAGAHAAHELEDDDGHKQNVVHRDLSPHNILVNADGFTKVCDFGVAKALNQLHEATVAGQLKGKISYMSPEQTVGDPVDRRSDVFSLGCVLFEATTGMRPFRGEGEHNVMQAIVNGSFDPPSQLVRNYPPALERIVLRALANAPHQRFATAEQMRFALEEFLARGPLVTQSHVATLVRSRLGDLLEKRREKIKQASSADASSSWEPKSVPPARDSSDVSGVKPASPSRDRTNFGRTPAGFALGRNADSSTIPQASPGVLGELGSDTPESGTPILARELLEARALTASVRDVPVPIVSPIAPPPAAPTFRKGHYDERPVGNGQYVVAALIGLGVALVIGGLGYAYWSGSSDAPRASVPAAPSAAPPVVVPESRPVALPAGTKAVEPAGGFDAGTPAISPVRRRWPTPARPTPAPREKESPALPDNPY